MFKCFLPVGNLLPESQRDRRWICELFISFFLGTSNLFLYHLPRKMQGKQLFFSNVCSGNSIKSPYATKCKYWQQELETKALPHTYLAAAAPLRREHVFLFGHVLQHRSVHHRRLGHHLCCSLTSGSSFCLSIYYKLGPMWCWRDDVRFGLDTARYSGSESSSQWGALTLPLSLPISLPPSV